jgi:hypothetical protein
MHYDVQSDFNLAGGLPKGSAKLALDSDIAGEGGKVIAVGGQTKVILSNGDQVAYTPPPEKLVMPDLSVVKSIRHYFGQRSYEPYPAWFYHQDGRSILLKDHRAGAEVGIVYREASQDERNRYGIRHLWDWEEGCLWRPNPWVEAKFDPKNPGSGKTVIYQAPDAANEQHKLVAALIPAVAAAVAQSLKASGPAAPSSIDPEQWERFLAFQAFQKTQEIVTAAAGDLALDSGDAASEVPETNALFGSANALSPEQDRMLWENEAKKLGVKVDGRWSLERLRSECEKAAGNA